MRETRAGRRPSRAGLAWLLLCLALAVHVADEALTGFLPVYNQAAHAIRELFPFLPVPILSVTVWLSATIGLVAGLSALAPLAYRGLRFMRVAMVGLALIALGNVTGHIGGSIFAGSPVPGVYSTPLHAAAGVYGLVVAWRWQVDAAGAREERAREGGPS